MKSHEVSEIKKDEVSAELVMRLLKEAVQEVDRLKTKVEEVEQDKQEAVKDASEKLSEYKVEMENLRSRFKLMSAANAEKSSSESIMENFEVLYPI